MARKKLLLLAPGESIPEAETDAVQQHLITTEDEVSHVNTEDAEFTRESDEDDSENEYLMPLSESETDLSMESFINESEEENVERDHCDPDGDDIQTILSSDEDDNGLTIMARYCRDHRFVPNPDGSIEIHEGQIFGNIHQVRDCIKRYAIQEGFQLKKMKNDACRFTTCCINKSCDWRVHASRLPDGVTFMIKSINGGHNMCRRVAANKEANSRWVASVLKCTILANPTISIRILRNELRDRFAVECDTQTIYRAKKRVIKNLKADHVESYSKIRKYANAIITMNPGSYAKVSVTHGVGPVAKFERFFLSFHASQIGFNLGCRPLLGVDGCHLTSPFEGVMLTAVALDADSGIFPVAICVCESESTQTWTWFLGLLKECLGWEDKRPICFMSDRQKGGLNALQHVWPLAGKRYCFRHMLANFRTVFKSHSMNGKLWAAARAASETDFKKALETVKEDSLEAYNWLINEESPDKWSRHAFDDRIKSDHITNNMSESFNNWVKEERDKPLMTLLEHLRRRIMVRFVEKYNEVEKMTDSVSSYAKLVLRNNDNLSRRLTVVHGKGEWYETIERRTRKILVNINDRYCDCGMWQLSGIPCKHAIAVLTYRREPSTDHVHWYYSKEAMKLTYGGYINPIPDESKWPTFQSEIIEPPVKRAKIGRPKKIRRRAADEPRASSKTFTGRCTGCKQLGHNIRTCKSKGKDKATTLAPSKSRKWKTQAKTPSTHTMTATPPSARHTISSNTESQSAMPSVMASREITYDATQPGDICSQIGSTHNN